MKKLTNGFNRAIWATNGEVYYRSSCHTWQDDESITREFPSHIRCGVYNTEFNCVEDFIGDANQVLWKEFSKLISSELNLVTN